MLVCRQCEAEEADVVRDVLPHLKLQGDPFVVESLERTGRSGDRGRRGEGEAGGELAEVEIFQQFPCLGRVKSLEL